MTEPKLYVVPQACSAVLATFRNSAEASLAQAALRDAGIPCVMAGTTVADLTPQFAGGGGAAGVRLLIRPEDAERAAKYLPNSALGNPAVVADLDRQFKRFLLSALALAAGLAGVFVLLGRLLGDKGPLVGCGVAFPIIVAFLISAKPAPADEAEEAEEPEE